MAISLLFALICVSFWPMTVTAEQILASTNNGDLRGFTADTVFGRAAQFLGVPYAKPPIGPLRWKPTEPPLNWTGMRSAESFGASCPQEFKTQMTHVYSEGFVQARILNQVINEDCLYLNIYAPAPIVPHRTDALPVLVYHHGGKYEWGSGTEFNGTLLALHGDIIVISFNYRLGIFGFISNGEPELAGNYGLLDTVRVLEWVQENIRAFGGDPSQVTLAGESAGSVTVDIFLTISPAIRNRGLMRRGIALSGAFPDLAHNYLKPITVQNTLAIAELLNCSSGSGSDGMVLCLRQKTTEELLSAYRQYKGGSVFSPNILVPYPDDIVIDKELNYPGNNTNGLDYMVGVCRMDSGFWFGIAGNGSEINPAIAKVVSHGWIQFYNPGIPDFMTDVAIFEYTSPDLKSAHKPWLELWHDVFFLSYAWKHGLAWPTTSNVYFYEFAHKPTFSVYSQYVEGASHMEELFFMFGDVFDPTLFSTSPTDEELDLSKQFMTAIANFVKSGNANPIPPTASSAAPPVWSTLDAVDKHYLEWGVGMSSANAKQSLRARQMEFWIDIIPLTLPVPVDGGWGEWGEWSPCRTLFSRLGMRFQQRKCNNPPPCNGGKDCVGREWRFDFC